MGNNFDFFGQTALVSDALNEEHNRFSRQQAPSYSTTSLASGIPKQTTKTVKTGYEKYKKPGYIPDLQVNPSLWGTGPSVSPSFVHGPAEGYVSLPPQPLSSSVAPVKKMMSLEEVEASMRSQPPKVSHHTSSQPMQPMTQQISHQLPPQNVSSPQMDMPHQSRTVQPHQHISNHVPRVSSVTQAELANPSRAPVQVYQRQPFPPQQISHSQESSQPFQILQNPTRQQVHTGQQPVEHIESARFARLTVRGPNQEVPLSSGPLPIITDPRQLMQLSEEERAAFLVEDAKRAKRNHKIFLLSRDNGFMTPQDKNFITRIQLQQLMTATGNFNDQDPDAALSEDFYYQVHSQIRGGAKQNPHQPTSRFAQAYLFQTGNRQGGMGRRQNRAGDNHTQRMEQQVQRAVEAAKLKPKNKQLVIEGSLGKIAFSNAKTPKPLLNIKRPDDGDVSNRPQGPGRIGSSRKLPQPEMSASDRKSILRNIEGVYGTLMQMEDLERRMPPPPGEERDPVHDAMARENQEWEYKMRTLRQTLWDELKVLEPITTGSSVLHPFIAFLSYAKGKRAVPRLFRFLDKEQRLTVLTILVVHLDILDVVRLAQSQPNESQLPKHVREEVELFMQAVMPGLFAYINEASLNIVIGLLGLILSRVSLQIITRTKVGLGIMTMLISRAEILKQGGSTDETEWEQWASSYNELFDRIEPMLAEVFPGSVNTGEDMFVWQFLAAMGIGATPEQQQRLVIAVKYAHTFQSYRSLTNLVFCRDRVMETVMQSKTLPPEMATQRLDNVNLFMRALGLDVELLG